MKNRYYIALGAICTALLSGCSDFLEGKSQDEVIVTTTKDYAELLLGTGYPSYSSFSYSMLDNLSDDVDFPKTVSDPDHAYSLITDDYYPQFTWQPTYYEYAAGVTVADTEYYKLYTGIMGCNAVLDGIDEAVGSLQEQERVKAEALASRAYHYFMLVNIYGEPYNYNKTALGVPLKLTATLDEKGQERNTVEEVYNQIVNDLKEASSLLKKYDVTEKDFKINLPTVYILLSRVYLFMEEWQKAADEATKAMEYGLGLWNLTALSLGTSNGYTVYPQPNSYDSPETFWCHYTMAWGRAQDISPTLSEEFLELYESDPNDVRFGAEGYYAAPLYNYSGALSGYLIRKLSQQTGNTTTVLGAAIRLSEAYLNRAEAYAKLNKKDDAIKDLNKLRQNRIKGYVDQTEFTDLLGEIRTERRKEFCFEGMRWFDLRRYGMPEIHHDFQTTATAPRLRYTLKEKDPMYTLPIPSSVILINPAIKQNASASTAMRDGANI